MNNTCGPSGGSPIDFVTRTGWNDPSRLVRSQLATYACWSRSPSNFDGVHLETLKRINDPDGMTIVHICDHSQYTLHQRVVAGNFNAPDRSRFAALSRSRSKLAPLPSLIGVSATVRLSA